VNRRSLMAELTQLAKKHTLARDLVRADFPLSRQVEAAHRRRLVSLLQQLHRISGAPPAKGDRVSWRGHSYTVKRVTKWTVSLNGRSHDVTMRGFCPIAEGGAAMMRILRRAS
jgi:hypothetical protein